MHFAIQSLELPVRLRTAHPLTDEELLRFSSANDILRVEQESNGDLLVMSPTGAEGSAWNSEIVIELGLWARVDGRGKVFDSNGGFRLPDGSVRAADACWVSHDRWNALSHEDQRRFAPLSPEFVIELRSPSDSLPELQAKMLLWIQNGVQLAWLLDGERRIVEIYCPSLPPRVLEHVTEVHGEGPVQGFSLDLHRLWA